MGLTKAEMKKDIAAACSRSLETTARVLFPNRFRLEFSLGHRQMFQKVENSPSQLIAIAAPRGFGKSSIFQLAYPAQQILTRRTNFFIPVSCSVAQSTMHSENLKRELRVNRAVKDIYGNLESDLFNKEMWRCNNPTYKDNQMTSEGTLVFPRSYNQEIRGFIFGDYRPDLFVVDDLEDKESVHIEYQRMKRKAWFYSDLMGAVDLSDPSWKIVYIGTVLHDDALLSNLLVDPNWDSLRLEMFDDDLNSMWPEKMSNAKIAELYQRYLDAGLLDELYREFRNLCIPREGAPFDRSMFRYYEPEDLKGLSLEHMVIVDPATSTGSESCDTAIVCLATDRGSPRVLFRDGIAERLHPNEMAEKALDMCEKHKAHVLGFEVTGINEYGLWFVKNEIRKRNSFIELVPIKATRGPSQYIPPGSSQEGKDARIGAALVPLYRTGHFYHPKEHPLLQRMEEQLLRFPMHGKKDIIDAMAHYPKMMELGERYFKVVKSGDTDFETLRAMRSDEDDERSFARLLAQTPDAEEDWQV